MGGEIMNDNAIGVDNTVLQFTSCHFPALGNSSTNDLTE